MTDARVINWMPASRETTRAIFAARVVVGAGAALADIAHCGAGTSVVAVAPGPTTSACADVGFDLRERGAGTKIEWEGPARAAVLA